MRYLFSLILVILTFSLSTASEGFWPFYNPAPKWVKKGLVVVYSLEGGSATGVNTPKASGVYGKGYLINVVLDVYERKPYGLRIMLLSSGYSTFFDMKLIDLSTSLFYLDAPSISRDIREKKSPPNCRLSGTVGRVFMNCFQNGLSSKYIIQYDPESGLVKNLVVSQNSLGRNITQLRASYIKHFYTEFPDVANFPSVAFKNHSYLVYSLTPMGKMPVGNIDILYKGRVGGVLHYQETNSGYPVEKLGVALSGPDYIHPAWLSRKVLLSVPEAGFEIVRAGRGNRGGVLLKYIWRGVNLMEQELDPKTGLLLYQRLSLPGGFFMTSELQK